MRRNQGMYIDSVVFLKGNVTIGHIDALACARIEGSHQTGRFLSVISLFDVNGVKPGADCDSSSYTAALPEVANP